MDQTKYVNSYIESAMTMLQENIVLLVQMKAQVKVLNDSIIDKDKMINDLTNKINTNTSFEQEYQKTVQRNQSLENEMIGLKNKVSHMDTLMNQFNGVKALLKEKEEKIKQLKEEINLKPKKTKIIFKEKNEESVNNKPQVIVNDDF